MEAAVSEVHYITDRFIDRNLDRVQTRSTARCKGFGPPSEEIK